MPTPRFSLNVFPWRGSLCLLVIFWSSTAWAEKAQFAYDLGLSGSLLLLQSGGSSMASSALPGDMVNKHNNPWLMLTNSSKDATLDKFVMSIGDEDFHFSQFTIGNQAGTFDIDVNIIDGGNDLELVFANFNPGETVFIQFQLRPDDPNTNQFPDFRNVLFNANGISTAENSVLTAVFNDPVVDQDDTLTGQLPNFISSTAAGMNSSCFGCVWFPVNGGTIDAFYFSQQDNLAPPVVPEPSGLVLMLLGSALTAFGYFRRRSLLLA